MFGTDDSLEWKTFLDVANLVEYLLHLLACSKELLECITFLYRHKVSVITILCFHILFIVQDNQRDICYTAEALFVFV